MSSSSTFTFSNLVPLSTSLKQRVFGDDVEQDDFQMHCVFAAATTTSSDGTLSVNLVLATRGENYPPDFIATRGSEPLFTAAVKKTPLLASRLECLFTFGCVETSSIIVAAGFSSGVIVAWNFEKSTAAVSAASSSSNLRLLSSSAPTLLSRHLTAVQDITIVPNRDRTQFFLVAVGGASCTVTALSICPSSKSIKSSRTAKHLSPSPTSSFRVVGHCGQQQQQQQQQLPAARFLVDFKKVAISMVYDRKKSSSTNNAEDSSNINSETSSQISSMHGGGGQGGNASSFDQYQAVPERVFETHLLSDLLSSSSSSSSSTPAWAGRFAVPRGSGLCDSPVACGRKMWIEDADAIRADFRRVQDHEVAQKVLLLAAPAPEQQQQQQQQSSANWESSARAMLDNLLVDSPSAWASGGLSIVGPDVCCVVVNFRRIVALLRLFAPAGGQLSAAKAAVEIEAGVPQCESLFRRVIDLCDTASRLLLSRPDCRHVENNDAPASEKHVDPTVDTVASFFSPRCVCRVPEDVVDRAIFAVHATAVALAVPDRGFCVDNDFELAGAFCEVTWPPAARRSAELPEFLHTVIRYMLHSECSRMREASRCFFGACLDRLTAAEKFAVQDALVDAWNRQRGGGDAAAGSSDVAVAISPSKQAAILREENAAADGEDVAAADEEPTTNSWQQLSISIAPTHALIALLLLVRSVRPVSIPSSPGSSSPASSRQGSSTVFASSPTTAAGGIAPPFSPTTLGLSQQDLEELGNYSPPMPVISLVGAALCDVARDYRCRSAVSAVMQGIALRVISEGWSTFSGFIPPAERRLIVCRLLMDAVVRQPAPAQLARQAAARNQQSSSGSGGGTGGVSALSQSELNATQPLVSMLARICVTMGVNKVVELFARCCALSDKEVVDSAKNAGLLNSGGGSHSSSSFSSSKETATSDADAHVGISIAAMRVLVLIIQIHPVAARRHIHSILSFVWAAVDPHSSGGGGSSSSASAGSPTMALSAASAAASPAARMHAAKMSVVALLFRTAVEYLPSFAFHHTTQRVAASAGDDGKIVLYDAKTTSKLAVVAAGSASVAAISFSPSGDSLAVLAGDAVSVTVWKVEESTSLFGLLSTSVSLNKITEVTVPPRTPSAAPTHLNRGNSMNLQQQQQQARQQSTMRSADMSNSESGTSRYFVSQSPPLRIVFASPKCVIVSLGSIEDVLVHLN